MTQLTAAQAAAGARRWWALGALALSVLVVGLDVFVLTLAIPTLSVDLHASTSDAQWFLDAYSLVLAGALLPAGLLGDLVRPQEAAALGAGLVRARVARVRVLDQQR